MLLELKRIVYNTDPRNTIGHLYIDGEFFCYTLEDEVRLRGHKVYGKTAIPTGTYKVIVDMSKRFRRYMPRILQVPDFTGVRLHGGNTAEDTHGCPLVAFNTDGKKIWGTAEKKLTAILKEQDDISLKITNEIGLDL